MKILSFKTKVGWITLEEKFNKIQRIQFRKKKNFGKSKNLTRLKHQIINFCLGKKKKINTNIQISGTLLQKKILTNPPTISSIGPIEKLEKLEQIQSRLN